jgi:hypothetical protein
MTNHPNRSQKAARSLEKIISIWRRTPIPEITDMAQQITDEAYRHGCDINLSDVLFLAFKAGFEAAAADAERTS